MQSKNSGCHNLGPNIKIKMEKISVYHHHALKCTAGQYFHIDDKTLRWCTVFTQPVRCICSALVSYFDTLNLTSPKQKCESKITEAFWRKTYCEIAQGKLRGLWIVLQLCNWACVVSETIKERRKQVIKIETWMSYLVVQSSCCRQWFKISFKECWYWRMLVILNRRKKKTWNWSGPYGTFPGTDL